MSDLISRKQAIEAFEPDHRVDWYTPWIVQTLEELPSARPEIIRCKECKFNYGVAHGCEFNPHDIVCTYFETDGMDAEDFCSLGEKYE